MKNNYTVHIPTPCHENWDAMTPVQQGRFCQSCAKEVVDFSMMTDHEVLNYFNKATGNTCGRFNNDQLQRPLQTTKIKKKKTWWVVAMMPLMLLFEKAAAQKKNGLVKHYYERPAMKLAKKRVATVNGELVSLKDTTTVIPNNVPQIYNESVSRVQSLPYNNLATTLVGRLGGYVYCKILPKQDTIPALIHRIYSKQAFTIYPNPTPRGSNVTIAFKNEGEYSIQLFDNGGKLITIANYNAAKASLQTTLVIPSSLTAGVYFIRLVNAKNKKQYTSKLIVF